MNKKMYLFFMLLVVLCSCKAEVSKNNYESIEVLDSVRFLTNIQDKIENAMSISIMTKDPGQLNNIAYKLDSIYKINQYDLLTYWKAYVEYSKSIYYYQIKEKKYSEQRIREGIDLIEKMKVKNSEDYSLLSLMQSFLMQYEKDTQIPFLFRKILQNCENAIRLNNSNLRAYYTKGSFNYYTPEQYGGGKTVETDLIKAIRITDYNKQNSYLPTWGKKESYMLLIEFYIKKKEWNNAVDLFQEALKKYPNDYQINSLASKLIGK